MRTEIGAVEDAHFVSPHAAQLFAAADRRCYRAGGACDCAGINAVVFGAGFADYRAITWAVDFEWIYIFDERQILDFVLSRIGVVADDYVDKFGGGSVA